MEFHRRHQARDALAVDVAEAQIRLYRREGIEVLSVVWYLYGDHAAPVTSRCALTFATYSKSTYVRVNLRAQRWQTLLAEGPPALYALVALTADGACEAAVHAAHDAIVACTELAPDRRADHLTVLWIIAEREDEAVELIRAYVREEELMHSVLYQEIFGKGELRGELRAVADLCEVLGIALTPECETWVHTLDLPQLAAPRLHLKRERAWPDAVR